MWTECTKAETVGNEKWLSTDEIQTFWICLLKISSYKLTPENFSNKSNTSHNRVTERLTLYTQIWSFWCHKGHYSSSKLWPCPPARAWPRPLRPPSFCLLWNTRKFSESMSFSRTLTRRVFTRRLQAEGWSLEYFFMSTCCNVIVTL